MKARVPQSVEVDCGRLWRLWRIIFLILRKLVCAGADNPHISARPLIPRGRDRKNLALDPCGDHAIDAVPVRLAGRIHPKLAGHDQPSPIIAAPARARTPPAGWRT